jgi:hypothetical protein
MLGNLAMPALYRHPAIAATHMKAETGQAIASLAGFFGWRSISG